MYTLQDFRAYSVTTSIQYSRKTECLCGLSAWLSPGIFYSHSVTIIHELSCVLNRSGQVDVIFLDYTRTFDKVSHSKLLLKFQRLRVPPVLIKWIQAYLKDRRQFVEIDNIRSRTLHVTSGVPQGSMLGPLLFLVYINDLPEFLGSEVSLRIFADDCVLYTPISSNADQQRLNLGLSCLKAWCDEWDMVINVQKTVFMSVTTKNNPCYFHMILMVMFCRR